MSDAITALSSALNNDMAEMRSISQNLANLNTSGYKRQITAVSSFQQSIMSNTQGPGSAVSLNQAATSLPRIEVYRDMTQGTLKFSGNSFDLAISGKGFLQVDSAQGVSYTRQGSFTIDQQGRLSLATGETVVGEDGAIHLQNSPFTIDREGVVSQDDEIVNKLKLVTFEDPQLLNYRGSGLFDVPAGTTLAASEFEGQIMQGYLETSNVQSLDEMIKMIETTRHFETSHQILRGYDSMLDNAINVLGDL
ncbi:MAG: flagellar basal-body rod protein FlgF [Cryomorphaceae bacterium]|jgi:flagellar basal-body rod protein FlgF